MELNLRMRVDNTSTSQTTIESQHYLHGLFELHSQNTPNQCALICDDQQFSYLQIEKAANQFARYLKKKGVGKGDCIGVLLDRSADVYTVLLGILKVGAAYVPLDPEYPAERINYILTDSGAKLLVTNIHLAIKHPSFACDHLVLESVKDTIAREATTAQKHTEIGLTPNDLCYIIYTSGSTGNPKGVQITHKNVNNYLQSATTAYQIKSADRIYQGFSIAFDASVEEIWLCFANGATLVAGTDKALHAGANLVEFLVHHKVTVLSCVPTLLAILDPPVTNLRLLILGGEVCSSELIKRWSSPGLRILNTYGPTEATVVTTYAECSPDKPITIGKPLSNYEVFILDEHLQPVATGREGELCISGDCLAQGYVNRPDLNAMKFITHSALNNKRLYRTGDLCRLLENGEIQFLGRIDDQVKVRGFRIELTEIETVIKEFAGIANAVVSVRELSAGVQSLIAYLVPNNKIELKVNKLSEFLRARLPDYMMPSIFEVIDELPLLASGKVDRKNLPALKFNYESIKKNYRAAYSAMEKKIVAVWEELFNRSTISMDDDFFYELNGHSLLAAKAVSKLRKLAEFESISMLDLYQNPTVAKLAEKFESANSSINQGRTNKIAVENIAQDRRDWRYYLCAVAQFFGCLFQFAVRAWEFLLVYLVLFVFAAGYLPIFLTVLSLIVGLPLVMIGFAIAAKWILLGQIKPGQYRLWGWYYFRWWLAVRIQRTFVPTTYIIGSPFLNLYLRLMGAKVGKNCHINSHMINSFDLLTIGDNTSIGYDSSILGYIVENGWLKIGSIEIGNNCYLGTRCVIGLNTVMQDNAVLEDLSMLASRNTLESGKHYHGSPACIKEIEKDRSIINPELFDHSGRIKNITFAMMQYIGLIFVTVIHYLTFLPGLFIVDHFYEEHSFVKALLLGAPLGGISSIFLYCAASIILKKILLGKITAGRHKTKSFFYLRAWIVERLLNNAELEVLCDSLYFPIFLRLIGAKIGKRVESGELPFVTADLLTMGEESFNASWVSMGVPRIYGGYVNYGPITIGKRAFVGNISLIPSNTEIGDGSLLGCLSIPPINKGAKEKNTSWFGTPAVFLPKREIFSGFPDKHIYQPTKLLYLTRLSIEFIRIILPSTLMFMSLVAIFLTVDFLYDNFSLLTMILLFPLFDIVILLAMVGVVILLKWILIGKFKPDIKPVWSVFIWKYDIIDHLYYEFLVPMILEPLFGTPFIAMFFRMLGCKIGKGVYIGTHNFAEYDLITIDDDVALNDDSILQTHLFEDRIFKMAKIQIKKGCNVGAMSVILYNTVMEPYSTLGNLSLLMKGERLPAYSIWSGVPAQATTEPQDFATIAVKELVDSSIPIEDPLVYSMELKIKT